MSTLLLDVAAWDLTVDAAGNIAVADDPYAVAQDVASALRTFQGELWYDTTQGVPYLQSILGQPLSAAYLKVQLVAAAMTVPKVASAQAFVTGFDRTTRQVSGQVQVTLTTGAAATVASGGGLPWYVQAITPPQT